MRIGLVAEQNVNAVYRAIGPMRAMERRGHEVVWPAPHALPDIQALKDCSVVHVYRRADDGTRPLYRQLSRWGTPIVYDNDDDHAAVPDRTAEHGGLRGQRIFQASVNVARLARIFTTTTDVLAEKYREAGVDRVEVIGNHLLADSFRQPRRHDGLVIGWVAGGEHRVEADRLKLGEVLGRLVAKHDHVRVECIGVNLGMPDRYRHDLRVAFNVLPDRINGFDIGIAPLVDLPFNRARSDIKVKEYAACGVPWVASPVGPYASLGPGQGGCLATNDAWFEVLDRLVSRPRERRKLSRRAAKWAKSQTIEAAADRWEQVFVEAAASAGSPST